ncbi:MAG TPA: hypothetical protein PKA10_05930 [Selenomonadales bacterium]|nr:hypothetical protein [Selenomonadales bacterium]
MEDKFTQGFAAGVLSGLITNIVDILMGSAGWTTLRYIDWTGIVVLAHVPPFTLAETIFSFFAQILFCAGLGVFFTYLVSWIGTRNLLLKSWLYSLLIWFAIDGLTTLYKIEGTFPLPLETAMANSVSATILGLVLGQSLKVFTRPASASSFVPQPAMKPADSGGPNDAKGGNPSDDPH